MRVRVGVCVRKKERERERREQVVGGRNQVLKSELILIGDYVSRQITKADNVNWKSSDYLSSTKRYQHKQ